MAKAVKTRQSHGHTVKTSLLHCKAENLLHSLKRDAAGIGLLLNALAM